MNLDVYRTAIASPKWKELTDHEARLYLECIRRAFVTTDVGPFNLTRAALNYPIAKHVFTAAKKQLQFHGLIRRATGRDFFVLSPSTLVCYQVAPKEEPMDINQRIGIAVAEMYEGMEKGKAALIEAIIRAVRQDAYPVVPAPEHPMCPCAVAEEAPTVPATAPETAKPKRKAAAKKRAPRASKAAR